MAELYMSRSGGVASDLALLLRDDLDDRYSVVVEPTVYGKRADVLVVGGERAFALYARDWSGEVRAHAAGDWRLRTPNGDIQGVPNPRAPATAFAAAWRSFLKDEFARLSVPLQHMVVLTDPSAVLVAPGGTIPTTVSVADVVSEIQSFETGVGAVLDADRRRELAAALCERQLTRNQRAAQPFVVDRSGFWGPARRHRTVIGLLRHLDRHPASGVHHLRNGSLETWLRGQGAFQYADLAAEASRKAGDEPRASWERFLQQTGLFARPKLSVSPTHLFLGYGFSDQTITGELRIRKGRGRGFVSGAVQGTEPWLQVDPRTFVGGASVVVSADPRSLSLKVQPQKAMVEITSNATDEPVTVPITVRVQPRPSPVYRWIVKPVLAVVLGILVGGAVGWATGTQAVVPPAAIVPGSLRGLSANGLWALYLGAVGGLAGLVRGLRQHAAWPAAYGGGRWLARSAFWMTVFVSVAWMLLAFAAARFPAATDVATRYRAVALALAAMGGLIAATIGQVSMEQKLARHRRPPRAWPTIRRGLVAAGVAAVLVLAVSTTQEFVWPALHQAGIENRADVVKSDATELAGRGESVLKNLVDRLFTSYYDKQAPMAPTIGARTPVAAGTPSVVTTPVVGATQSAPAVAPTATK